MSKVVVVLHGGPASRAERRTLLVETQRPTWCAAASRVSVVVADEAADVRGPNPFPTPGLPVALVNLWLDDVTPAVVAPLLTPLVDAGFRVAAYRVDESVPQDFGDTPHGAPRDWPDGTRSPYVTAVSLLERPAGVPRDVWVARWHGGISEVSGQIQPRVRYVRNVVLEALTDAAPQVDGIVEEVWPSPRHVANPFLFYGASNPVSLVVNMTRILASVASFTRPWRVRTFMASEWWLRS